MKINPTNTNFLDFLDIISGILTIKTFEISVNYDDTLIGTLEQLKELSKNTELFELKKFVFELNQKSNYEITDIEVMGYLKELTQNFEFQFVKAALFEIDVFENMVFNETMDERAREVYEKNKWEIPIRKYKGFSNEIVSRPDYEKMRNKVFPHLGMQLYKAKKILKNELERSRTNSQQDEKKTEQEIPKTFEELFYKAEHAEPCLKILSELQPPVIDAINNYIGKAKGVFPLWVKVLKNHKPEPLIKHFKDAVYKDLLNQKVKGLNLSKDASEFRKQYKRVENDKIELDIKTILSQYSQSGKLGK